MAKLGQQAHFRNRGDRNPHVAIDDALENRGYAVWTACSGKIKTSHPPIKKGPVDRGVGDVDGYEIEINLKRKMFDLWPVLNQMDTLGQNSFFSEIYGYLRQSGNAVCVRQPGVGAHGIPLWWVRKDWNDVHAIGVFKTMTPTSTERRLTPQEVGEDRPPAPVTVEKTPIGREQRIAQILKLLRESPQPLYQREFVDAMGLNAVDVGRLLRELVDRKRIYRRMEGKGERPSDAGGRYRYLYWFERSIPLRKVPLDTENRLSNRVAAIKPGELLLTRWMNPAVKQEVQELVEAGILEYVEQGTVNERIRLVEGKDNVPERPEAPSAEVTEVRPEPAPEPEPEAAPDPQPEPSAPAVSPVADADAISRAITRLIDSEVAKRAGGLEEMREQIARLREQLEAERSARSRAEAGLIAARTELSDVKRRFEVVRDALRLPPDK